MDYYNKHETLNTTNYSTKLYSYTRNVVQVLVLASVFSFLYSQSFASNFSIKFLACTTERNCIFLLCNGILVLIIRTSGLIRRIGPVSGIDDHHGERVREPQVSQEKIKANVVIRKVEHVVGQNTGGDQEDMGAEEVRNGESRNKEEFKELVYDQNYENEDIEQEEEEEEEEEEGLDEEYLLSRDELNKKCEEFITRMKQSIQRA